MGIELKHQWSSQHAVCHKEQLLGSEVADRRATIITSHSTSDTQWGLSPIFRGMRLIPVGSHVRRAHDWHDQVLSEGPRPLCTSPNGANHAAR